jgi:hypothetical protein
MFRSERLVLARVQDPDHALLGAPRRERGDAQVVGLVLDLDPRLSVLGAEPVGDVELPQDLDARDDAVHGGHGELHVRPQHPVDPDADLPLAAPRLDVDVGRPRLDGLADDEVRGLDHRARVRVLLRHRVRAPVLHDLHVSSKPGSRTLGESRPGATRARCRSEKPPSRALRISAGEATWKTTVRPEAKASERSASRSVGSQVATVSWRSVRATGKMWNFRATDSGIDSAAFGSASSGRRSPAGSARPRSAPARRSLIPSAFVAGAQASRTGVEGASVRALGRLMPGALRHAQQPVGRTHVFLLPSSDVLLGSAVTLCPLAWLCAGSIAGRSGRSDGAAPARNLTGDPGRGRVSAP